MTNFHFIKSREKRKILEEFEKEYGIKEMPYLLLETGRQKIRGFSGNLSKEEIIEIAKKINVEIIGMYLISRRDEDLRLSFDAVPLFKEQITNNIVEINKEQLELWLRGYDLEINVPRGIAVIKYNEDLVGVGKSNTEKIFNYLPKERKLKIPLPKKD